jgi:hypothetical protein
MDEAPSEAAVTAWMRPATAITATLSRKRCRKTLQVKTDTAATKRNITALSAAHPITLPVAISSLYSL